MGRSEGDGGQAQGTGDRHNGQAQAQAQEQGTRNRDAHKKTNLFQKTHAQRPTSNEREKDQ
jgi:hypothetical protein